MGKALLCLLFAAVMVGAPVASVRAREAVVLIWPHRLSKMASALPRLRDASGVAASRINAALQAADGRLRKAIADCGSDAHADGKRSSEWDRTVTVTMAGPVFLSLVTNDSAFCDGPHPNFQQVALTFDLQTGRPVDWAVLLPAPVVETTVTEAAMEETTMGLVRSKLLVELGTDPAQSCGLGDDAAFQLWLDAKTRSVQVAWADPPHANESCGDPFMLDVGFLQAHRASSRLIQALRQAPRNSHIMR